MIEMDIEAYKAKRREVVRKSQAKRRENARKNGLCSQCCKRPPLPYRSQCEVCLARQRAAQMRYYHVGNGSKV